MILNQVIGIETERLIIRTMSLRLITEVLNNDINAYDHIGVNFNEEWPSSDIMPALPIFKAKLEKKLPDGYGPWIFIDKADNTIIGDGGFKGCPNEIGEIEIGYNIVESKRMLGYGYEAVNALIEWAFSQESVKVITAECLRDNMPSINLLNKVGMTKVRDDEGLVYLSLDKGI